MATVKRSVTLDADLVAEACAIVDERGFSRLVNEGLRQQILVARGLEALEALDAAHGPVPPDDLAAVDVEWPG